MPPDLLPRNSYGIEPPPGVVPNFVDPANDALFVPVVGSVLLVVTGLVVIANLGLTLYRRKMWTLDRWFLAIALLFSIAQLSMANIGILQFGMGRHIWNIPPPPAGNLDLIYRLQNIRIITYELGVLFTKLSVLAFYLSIFGVYISFRRCVYGAMAFVTAYLVAFVFVDIFMCTPIQKFWYPITVPGTCLSQFKTQTSLGVLNTVTDAMILFMPFPLIASLNMSRSKMVGVGAVFAIGSITVAAAIARTAVVAATIGVIPSRDQSFVIGQEVNWLNIELLTGLLCASLLSLPGSIRIFLAETKAGKALRKRLSRGSRSSDMYGDALKKDPYGSGSRGSGGMWKCPQTPNGDHVGIELRGSTMSTD